MKNKFQLSRELKHKIKTELVFSMETPVQIIEYAGHKIALPTPTIITGILKFDFGERYLYEECVGWLYNSLEKVDVGRFKGIYPIETTSDTVKINIDYYEEESWKDWFIDDDL